MKVAAILIAGALVMFTILEFSSGEWHLPMKGSHATIIGNSCRIERRPLPAARGDKRQDGQPLRKPLAPIPPVRVEDVIRGTPESVYEMPSLYAHRYVMLDEWKMGWVNKIPSSQFPQGALARKISDCDWYLGFNVDAGACMSSNEKEHVKQLAKDQQNVWGLPNADLLCYVEAARFNVGFLLTHCRAVPIPLDVEIAREKSTQSGAGVAERIKRFRARSGES